MQLIKKQFLLIFLITPFSLVAQKTTLVQAQPVAYIEQSKLLKSLKGFEQNSREVDSLKQVYANQIQESTKKLEEKVTLLLKPYDVKNKENIQAVKSRLNNNDSAKLELYIQESELIDKAAKNYDLMIKALYDQKVQPLIDKVNTTIEAYATTHKIMVVYVLENITPALAYINKGINITDDINKILAK